MNIIRNALVIALLAAAPAYAQQKTPAQPAAQQQQGGGPDAVFAQWDTDKNGALSKDEFRVGWAAVRNEMLLQRLHMEWEQRDADKSGKMHAKNDISALDISAPAQRAGVPTMRFGLILSEVGEGFKRNLSMVVSVILVTFISLTFFGAARRGRLPVP